jgi:hypothetical protein
MASFFVETIYSSLASVAYRGHPGFFAGCIQDAAYLRVDWKGAKDR